MNLLQAAHRNDLEELLVRLEQDDTVVDAQDQVHFRTLIRNSCGFTSC